MFGIRLSLTVTRERLPSSTPLFPHVLEIAQPDFTRRDSAADGTTRTLSRIDRACINLPMSEARDFHCYSHVFENLGERSIPSHNSVQPGQTHSELDVQTSRFLLNFETDRRRSPKP